tara:strand:+ start:3685 stop:3987 length:303 start_codon:yes stop_codon:yes gene_type:complete
MDNLKLTPFSDKEMEDDYSSQTFKERGIDFTLIRLSNQQKPQSGNLYKFGLIDNDYHFYWFFCNKAIVKGRLKALETFHALLIYCEQKDIGKPFAYKVIK